LVQIIHCRIYVFNQIGIVRKVIDGAFSVFSIADAFVFDGANIMHYSEIIAMFAKEFEKISYADI
jgi:hypothetical protein